MSNQINAKLLKAISILYQLQRMKLRSNLNLHNYKRQHASSKMLGLSVINQLNMMNKSEKILLNIGGMPVSILSYYYSIFFEFSSKIIIIFVVVYDISKNFSILSKHTFGKNVFTRYEKIIRIPNRIFF